MGGPRGGDPSLAVLYLIDTAPEPIHGYAIAKRLEEGTGYRIQAGMLYGILYGLENRGLVVPETVDPAEGSWRRVYRTTGQGRDTLKEDMGMLVQLFPWTQMFPRDDWPVLNLYG